MSSAQPASQPNATETTRAALLRNGEFLAVWVVGAASSIVRWLEMLAIGVFVFDLTGSPFQVALMLILRLLPMALLGAVIGAVAERVNRRDALIVGLLIMIGVCLAFTALVWTGRIALWHVALSAVLNGLFWTLDNPVRRTLLSETVDIQQLGAAMSLDMVTNNIMRFLGPVLGGVFLEFWGLDGIFVLGAVLYGIAALAALKIRSRPRALMAESLGVLNLLVDGLRLLRSHRVLTGVLVVTVIFNIWGFPFISMIPVIGKDVLGLTPFPVGLLVSAEGAGSVIGALLILGFGQLRHYRRLYTYGTFLYLGMALVFSQLAWVLPSAACLVVVGLGAGLFSAMQGVLIILCTPFEARSRMMGVLSVCIGTSPIGFLHIGMLANWLGPQAAIATCALEGLLALLIACWVWPEIRESQPLPKKESQSEDH